MRSPLYYKKCGCGQIMTSHRRRGYEWSSVRSDAYYIGPKYYIEHYCPACDKTSEEPTDSEWRPKGKELDLGTYGGNE
jgi:hypothetical protein